MYEQLQEMARLYIVAKSQLCHEHVMVLKKYHFPYVALFKSSYMPGISILLHKCNNVLSQVYSYLINCLWKWPASRSGQSNNFVMKKSSRVFKIGLPLQMLKITCWTILLLPSLLSLFKVFIFLDGYKNVYYTMASVFKLILLSMVKFSAF